MSARWIQVNVNIVMKMASNLQLHTEIMDSLVGEKCVEVGRLVDQSNTTAHQTSVIYYPDEQLKLMKNSIVNGCIIGLNRSFNVSSCYITVVCFKNKNVIKKNTSEPPIMLTPIFMHLDGNFETYHRFISPGADLAGTQGAPKINVNIFTKF